MSDLKSKLHFDRCFNPFKLDNHFKRESLRKPSATAKSIFPHLTDAHYLCSTCRKKIASLREKNYRNVTSSAAVVAAR